MADGLDVVAVRVADERGVVVSVVLGPDPRLVQDLGAGADGGGEELADCLAAGGGEREVVQPGAGGNTTPFSNVTLLRTSDALEAMRRSRISGLARSRAKTTPGAALESITTFAEQSRAEFPMAVSPTELKRIVWFARVGAKLIFQCAFGVVFAILNASRSVPGPLATTSGGAA